MSEHDAARPVRVVVTSIVSLNPGDAAILLGMQRLFMRAFGADVDVLTVDKNGAAAAQLYPWMRFQTSLFGKRARTGIAGWLARRGYEHRVARVDAARLSLAARLLARGLRSMAALLTTADEREVLDTYLRADLVVASGGTYLVPTYGVDAYLREYELVLQCGRPLGFMPQSMGPFNTMAVAARLRAVFAASRFMLLRDDRSRRHVAALGAGDTRLDVVPDAAFALADPSAAVFPEFAPAGTAQLRVAVSVREWQYFERDGAAKQAEYFAAVAELVAWLVVDRGSRVTFVSSCQGIPDYWSDDSNTATQVHALLPPAVAGMVAIDREFRGPEALQAHLGTYDLVIATRMHVAILAVCAGVPVVPIAYEFKTRELFEAHGLGELVVEIDGVRGEDLTRRTACVIDESARVLPLFRRMRATQVARLEDIPRILRAALDGRVGAANVAPAN